MPELEANQLVRRNQLVITRTVRGLSSGANTDDIRAFGMQTMGYAAPFLTANRSAFGNGIYRPRSDLVFSAEYRRIRTFNILTAALRRGR